MGGNPDVQYTCIERGILSFVSDSLIAVNIMIIFRLPFTELDNIYRFISLAHVWNTSM